MKPVIVFVAACAVSTAGSAGVKVMITKPVHPAASADSTKIGVDSIPADSAAKASAKPAETKPAASAAGDSAHTPGRPITPKVATVAESTGAPIVTPQKTPAKPAAAAAKAVAPVAATPAPADSVVEASERRLAKVFTAMEPKQAAKVLEHMEDADVQIILGYVGPRQAASIMAELKPERVATLSKRAMQAKTK